MRTLSTESPRSPAIGYYAGLIIFSLLGTLLSRTLHLNPGPIAPVAAALTLLAGLWALLAPGAVRVFPGSIGAAGRTLIFGAGVELVGISTGWPFGAYRYSDRWWPTISTFDGLRFPLLVPFAWVLVAGAAHFSLTDSLDSRIKPILAGLIAAICDLVMEPVMTGSLGYWTWTRPGPLPGGAPIWNFLGWWATAAVASWMLQDGGWKHNANGLKVLGLHLVLILGLGGLQLIGTSA